MTSLVNCDLEVEFSDLNYLDYQGNQASLAPILLISQNFPPSDPPPPYLISCQDEPF